MRRVGLIGDVHGNAVALDAVLADMANRGVEEIVCLGDIAAGGPQPLLANPGGVGLPLVSLVSPPAAPPLPSRAEYALVEVYDGGLEVTFGRVAVGLATLAAATAAMPHGTWALDLERRIERWNARAAL